jgi:pimeloyl-ACP methyl ester carboxylesterase
MRLEAGFVRLLPMHELLGAADAADQKEAEQLPNANLRIYPDADHGFLYRYPELFTDHVRTFLDE